MWAEWRRHYTRDRVFVGSKPRRGINSTPSTTTPIPTPLRLQVVWPQCLSNPSDRRERVLQVWHTHVKEPMAVERLPGIIQQSSASGGTR